MRTYNFKAILKAAIRTMCLLPFAAVAAFGQQQINLTAGPATATLPDGTTVPMWGYSCAGVTGTAGIGGAQTCAKLNPAATGWSPVVITVPTGQGLQINLTNSLPSPVPTSLVIVGQLGGGLGTTASTRPSPVHPPQGPTWPIAGDNSGPTFNPPGQPARVQSFSTEVAAGSTTLLPTWTSLRAGTYLIESGTHPSIQGPMGLYGILVVTSAPTVDATGVETAPGTAYTGVTYNADVPLLLSEIDPVQNNAVNTAVTTVGFSETATHNLKLADAVNSIAVTDGGAGYKSTDVLTVNITGGGTPTTMATATATIDTDNTSPTYGQVISIAVTNPGAGYTSNPTVTISGGTPTRNATAVSGLLLANSDPCAGGVPACYPPAVNYTPLYYLLNGVAFDKTHASASLFSAAPGTTAPVTGNVLVRLVNAGLRMHVPSIVGSQTTGQTGAATPLVTGFQLIAEDGNPLPGVRRVQSEVFMAAGKTYDVMINVPAAGGTALPVFDRELSLSGNATARDAGMLAYIGINGSTLPTTGVFGNPGASANNDAYFVVQGNTLNVSDPAKGLIANDMNVYGVKVSTPAGCSNGASCALPHGALTLNGNGTFTYVPDASWSAATPTTQDSFVYQANGSSALTATVMLNTCTGTCLEGNSGITVGPKTYTSNLATSLSIKPAGVLSTPWDACTPSAANPCHDSDAAGYPLTVDLTAVKMGTAVGGALSVCTAPASGCLVVKTDGSFNAMPSAAGTYTFTYKAKNSQGTQSASSATVTLNFPAPSGLTVTVLDGKDKATVISDYRWIIEEDRTFYIDPTKTTNTGGSTIVPTFGTNFHTSYMPVVATGCVGTTACESGQTVLGAASVCDVGNGGCEPGLQQTPVNPSQVHLDPNKRYYISVLPGDAANPFNAGSGSPCDPAHQDTNPCGHGMGGAPIGIDPYTHLQQTSVTVLTQPTPFPPAKLSVFVFEDDFPLNGEHDAGGGVDIIASNEPGLGGFQITLFDDAGGSGDATGQPTYDMFNMPLSNSLAGTPDPANHGIDACPISVSAGVGFDGTASPGGITGMIVTCPKYEADGVTLSPLAGQAVIANLYPGRYGVVATPAADRIARGEEWLQTNTLDGQKAHDSFLRIGEPSFFQEYGPAGYHVTIGFANPKIINDRLAGVCTPGSDPTLFGANCGNSVKGVVTTERMSRTPDERLYSSGDNSSFAFTQCYVSIGDPDGEDFAFTKCAADGSFSMSGLPDGTWRITVFDQWNDMLVDGLSTPVGLSGGAAQATTDMGQIAMNQWQANIYTKSFLDLNNNGIQDTNEPGLTLVSTNIRFRDGSFSNFNNTDLSGNAGFNEIFPLFSWYVVETDSTRYKNTGIHVVYDAGGPADGTCTTTTGAPCGASQIGMNMANTVEQIPVPPALRVPGARYCASADCPTGDTAGGSTGRVDPAWVESEGWQGFSGQNSFLEFGKKPFVPGENGGIHGHVVYASTRPFDDPQLLLQLSWEPQVPNVTINLYQEGTAPDGTQSLKLVDTTKTSSFDDWAQGFRSDGNPNMNCPGQGSASGTNADLFFFSLYNQPAWLDAYNNGGTPAHTIPNNSQYKCYDGMHNWNQLQPAPYDGAYRFPSVTGLNTTTGKPTGTNCTICVANPDASDPYRVGTPMLPVGKYVVEVVVPPGYELVKEEDKNILIGDNYIAPVTQQFAGLGNIFILPDQAAVGAAYNPYNPQNPTQDLGSVTFPRHEGDTGSVESFWPCVGASRIVPDYISLFPKSAEVSPFAGATRNLCDRKEVTLTDQASELAKFYLFTSTHAAAHFTGVITDDFTSEFDPFSPQFGEKFSPANLPISIKDWTGTEISRVYTDQWGAFNGLNYSTWEVNPPNPTGYAPQMMVTCMNDPGTGTTPDPLFNPAYSQFCYEIPFMPGQTQYMDTPVVPTSAFAGAGYNNPDCAYPDATPAIKEVDGAGVGPWVHTPSGSIDSLTLLSSGSGYNSTFNFNITGGGGSGATGQVTDLKLVSISSIPCGSSTTGSNRCSNFATNPAVTITGGGGSGATATATKTTISDGSGTISFIVTSSGGGYTSKPTVTIPRLDGTTRTVGSSSIFMGVNGVALIAYGSGYTGSSFTVSISGASGSGATATATISTISDTLTITALGDQSVNNNAYSGPSATTAPYNQKTVKRHYGFGTTKGTVSIGGVNVSAANITTWNDTTIVVNVPANVPLCAVQQQAQYGGRRAFCGELVITAANGKQSVDAVTVTIAGKAPTVLTPGQTIQSAINAAAPGDLIIVPRGTYNELLLMWKPVRLQGVGAGSSIVNANTHPAGKLDPWRAQVICLFGLALNGQPNTGTNPYDSTGAQSCPGTGWINFSGGLNNPQVDRIPLEGLVGWDATLNGNLAEMLQEPSLMGAYEGAGITVLSKGVNTHGQDPFGSGAEATFPAGSTLLSSSDCATSTTDPTNPYPSNFQCNPSSIDGLGITNSSQGGGGILVHGWGHNLQIANNRIYNNAGTLSGGISVGQGEFPEAYLAPNSTVTAPPASCRDSAITNTQLPYCFNLDVNVHHNAVMLNSSTGDELFSATPAGAGGVSFCTGADFYKFNYNWVCGNLSTGDGGGVAQLGFSYNGDIEHNTFLFNQSTKPTIATNGGGLIVQGAPPDGFTPAGLECGTVTDVDCVPGLSDGTGPGLVINANLFMGNAAESGSGGGIRFQAVNGTDVPRFPLNPEQWYRVRATNNIIVNNVAGWDGAGVSLEDALVVDFINNTVVSNDTTASSGVLFNTLGAPLASSQSPPGSTNNGTSSLPQPAGLVALHNSPQLTSSFTTGPITCPTGHPNCTQISYPLLYNDVFWQNRTFYIGVGGLGSGTLNQQNVVSLYNAFTATQAPSQPQTDAILRTGNGFVITGGTGACTAASYWDIGVRGDSGPSNHGSTFTLAPTYSVLTDATDYPGLNNQGSNPTVVGQYCNGSRVPPELGSMGYQVPPGISDATVPNPIFNLTPAATVDEGNNWINISWGPLSMTNPVSGAQLGDYELAAGSPAINAIPTTSAGGLLAPTTDFFGHTRPAGSGFDIGAVEFRASDTAPHLDSITPNTGARGTSVSVTIIGTDLTGATAVNVSGNGFTTPIPFTVVSDSEITATFTISGTANLTARNVTVTTPVGTSNAVTFTVVNPPPATLTSISPTSGTRGNSVVVTLTGTNFTATGNTIGGLGTGVTASNIAVNAAGTQLTATFTITPTATLGARSVTVTNPSGTASGAVTFMVVNPPPATLTSISPATGTRGTSVGVTLTGTNFTATGNTIGGLGTGVTASNIAVNAAGTQLTATFTITPSATLGARSVTVTNPSGTASNAVTFTVVNPPAATLATISPTSATHPTTGSIAVPVTLTGTNFTATGNTIGGLGTGVTASNIAVNAAGTQLTATFTITSTAPTGPRNVTVTNPSGTPSNTVTFTVN